MNMVSVLVYLVVLYFCKVFQLTTKASKTEFILEKMHKYFTLAFSSYDPLEILLATISLLYNYVGHNCLNIWIAIANGLKHYMDDVKELSFAESDSTGYLAVCYFLSYPFAICSCPRRNSVSLTSCSSEKSHVSPQEKHELEHVFDAWMALYGSLKTSLNQCSAMDSFLVDLCSTLTVYLDEYASMQCINGVDSSHKDLFFYLLPLLGDAAICFLEDICASEEVSDESKYKNGGDHKISTGKSSSLRLAARYLSFLWTYTATDHPTNLVMTSRVSSVLAHFASFLCMKQDILLFIEIVSCPLLQWLSHTELRDKSIKNQLQLLWAKILNHLQSSQPPMVFNSAFLELQAPLLGKTLDHPNPTISEPTITFWNSTYGEQINLDYPQSLLHVLDKLSRNGRIILHKKILPALERCHSRIGVDTTPQRYRVTATHNKSSKRVGFVEDVVDQLQHEEKLYSKLKRNRLELTEHQKEVRRAQQGRERDCCGHGPGIRTYTSADFSQGNEDSQESQEFQNPESILEILQRVV
ncbi:hypothetical protein F2P56_023173 [Juglans regia]|uniref:Uncharacterized protein n=1 Tax=Juglans regia TaxID=51240 RepID=A0A833UK59_JUGRE|nr:hypothetical protein F2P56_023173 [Juglans regia]